MSTRKRSPRKRTAPKNQPKPKSDPLPQPPEPQPEKDLRGIEVRIPPVVRQRMEAICDTAAALRKLTSLLESSGFSVSINGNTIYSDSGSGISVKCEE